MREYMNYRLDGRRIVVKIERVWIHRSNLMTLDLSMNEKSLTETSGTEQAKEQVNKRAT